MIDPRATSLLLGISTIIIVAIYARKLPLPITIAWIYFLLHAIWGAISPWFNPNYVAQFAVVHLQKQAALTAITLLVAPAFILSTKSMTRYLLLQGIIWFLVADAIWLRFHSRGLMDAHSFDVAIMAITLPYLFFGKGLNQKVCYLIAVLFIATIFLSGGTTGYVCAIVSMGVYFLFTRIWLGLIPVAIFAVAFHIFVKGYNLWYLSGRDAAWIHYLTWWEQNVNPLIGAGSGSFDVLGVLLPVKNMRLMIMHNDFFQVLFETGYIGLMSILLMIACVLVKMRGRALLVAMSLSYCACMLAYFPLHYFVPQILGLILVVDSLEA